MVMCYPPQGSGLAPCTILPYAGTTTRNTNDTEKVQTSATWIKIKEMLLNDPIPCALSVYYGIKSGLAGALVWTNIYVNGVAVGVARSTSNDAGYTLTAENIGSSFNAGDLIQIYGKYDSTPAGIYVANMRLRYLYKIATIGGYTLSSTMQISDSIMQSVTNQDP